MLAFLVDEEMCCALAFPVCRNDFFPLFNVCAVDVAALEVDSVLVQDALELFLDSCINFCFRFEKRLLRSIEAGVGL